MTNCLLVLHIQLSPAVPRNNNELSTRKLICGTGSPTRAIATTIHMHAGRFFCMRKGAKPNSGSLKQESGGVAPAIGCLMFEVSNRAHLMIFKRG